LRKNTNHRHLKKLWVILEAMKDEEGVELRTSRDQEVPILLGWGDKKCVLNIGWETSWETSTWNTEKEVGG